MKEGNNEGRKERMKEGKNEGRKERTEEGREEQRRKRTKEGRKLANFNMQRVFPTIFQQYNTVQYNTIQYNIFQRHHLIRVKPVATKATLHGRRNSGSHNQHRRWKYLTHGQQVKPDPLRP
jgi:hypothetical protein